MNALYILSLLGTVAGSVGGALTGGLDGMVLGGSAGFVLGVLAWLTDHMEQERLSRAQRPEQLLSDINTLARLHPFTQNLISTKSTTEERKDLLLY